MGGYRFLTLYYNPGDDIYPFHFSKRGLHCAISGEDATLSHVPLVWMVREAQRAGPLFDKVNCAL